MPFNNTFTTYIGDGTTTDYPIPFPRIEDNDVAVLVDGVVTAYTLISSAMIRITPAPASGALILLQRETDVDEIKAIFQNGSPIPATQINRNFQQLLYVAQETAALRNVWFRTVGAPASSLGKQGDWAIDEETGELYQKITDSTWQSVRSLVGPTGSEWFSGSAPPAGSLGELTDFYLQANGDYFEKTGPTTWTLRGSLIGPVGPRGADGGPVPVGGSAGQVLSKVSSTDFDTTWATPAGGNVTGPASSVNNRLAVFSGTTGKIIADSGLTTANLASASHTHTVSQITGLTGRLLRGPRHLASGTSYTTPAGCSAIYVECVGGGGGGGASSNSGTGGGGGGGAGGYCAAFLAVAPATAYAYTIGSGGSGGSGGGSGGDGGDTTFTVGGTTLNAGGGGGGSGNTAVDGVVVAGGVGGSASGSPDLNVSGTRGEASSGGSAATGGSASFFGGGSGGGGRGAAKGNNVGTAGSAGLIRIWEYS